MLQNHFVSLTGRTEACRWAVGRLLLAVESWQAACELLYRSTCAACTKLRLRHAHAAQAHEWPTVRHGARAAGGRDTELAQEGGGDVRRLVADALLAGPCLVALDRAVLYPEGHEPRWPAVVLRKTAEVDLAVHVGVFSFL